MAKMSGLLMTKRFSEKMACVENGTASYVQIVIRDRTRRNVEVVNPLTSVVVKNSSCVAYPTLVKNRCGPKCCFCIQC